MGMKRCIAIEESNIFSHSETAAGRLGAEKTVDQSADWLVENVSRELCKAKHAGAFLLMAAG